jgi:hypothetical protein
LLAAGQLKKEIAMKLDVQINGESYVPAPHHALLKRHLEEAHARIRQMELDHAATIRMLAKAKAGRAE